MIEEIYSGMKHCIFADAENPASNTRILSDFLKKNNYISVDTQIICIIGADKCQNDYFESLKKEIGNRKALNITPIRISSKGENAADKILATYLGFAIARSPQADFVIVSDDNDYSPIVKQFTNVGVNIREEKLTYAKENKAKKTKASSPKAESENTDSPVSDGAIKELADKIASHKRTCPKTLKTLQNRLKPYGSKYNFKEDDLPLILKEIKRYLEKTKKASFDGKKNHMGAINGSLL